MYHDCSCKGADSEVESYLCSGVREPELVGSMHMGELM